MVVSWSLTDKELKAISVLKNGKKMSAREIKRHLEKEGVSIPYTTISSFLDKLYHEGILERKEVRSRGRYGKKYLYYLNNSILSVDSAHPLAEMIKNVLSPAGVLYSNDSVAFIDRNGVITFLYGGGKVINDGSIIGRNVTEIHSAVTARFVRQIFSELRNGKRNVFKRTVSYDGRIYEKHYCAIKSSFGEFLGVLVITRHLEEGSEFPEEIIYL